MAISDPPACPPLCTLLMNPANKHPFRGQLRLATACGTDYMGANARVKQQCRGRRDSSADLQGLPVGAPKLSTSSPPPPFSKGQSALFLKAGCFLSFFPRSCTAPVTKCQTINAFASGRSHCLPPVPCAQGMDSALSYTSYAAHWFRQSISGRFCQFFHAHQLYGP